MVQRIVSDDEDDEGQQSPAPRRSALVDVRNQELPSDGDDADDTPKDSPHGRKRARLDHEGRAAKRETAAYRNQDATGGSRRAGRNDSPASVDQNGGAGEDDGDVVPDGEEEEEDVKPKFETQPRDKDG